MKSEIEELTRKATKDLFMSYSGQYKKDHENKTTSVIGKMYQDPLEMTMMMMTMMTAMMMTMMMMLLLLMMMIEKKHFCSINGLVLQILLIIAQWMVLRYKK